MLDIKLMPKQWEVFRPFAGVDYDITLYQGGFGSGKTHTGVITGLSVLAENHGASWLVGADTAARLKMTTAETYEELLHDAKVKYRYNKTDRIIRIPGWDDARVIFKGLDDPMALRSVNGIGGHLEEASLLTEAAYLEFLGRLRQAKNNNTIRLILTTNPQSTRGWLFEHFVNRGGVTVENIRDRDVRISRRRVVASTLENKYVSDAFIATLKASYDPELYNIVVLGQDGDYTRGLVNYNFSDLNIQETEYKPDLDVYLSCDFNVDPMSWVCAHRFNGEYHFFDEVVVENTNIDECVRVFAGRYPNHSKRVIITGDASGNNRDVRAEQVGGTSYTQMINSFNKVSYPAQVKVDVRLRNPAPADRTAAWNAMVCNAEGVRRVFVHPRCKWLIWNCQNLRYKEGTSEIHEPTTKEIEKDSKQKFTKHVWDAASYLVEKYDPITFVSPVKRPSVVVPKALQNRFGKR